MKGRDSTIDIAKGIGIFLVAAGHSDIWAPLKMQWIGLAIFSFHMPLFFFLSGCFLPVKQSFTTVLSRRARGLLIPYLIVIPCYLLDHRDEPERFWEWLSRTAWGTGQAISWPWTPNWFLPHLFLAILLAWAISRVFQKLRLPLWVWPFLLGCLLLIGRQILRWESASPCELWERKIGLLGLPWGIDLLPLTVIYILAAPLWKEYARRVVDRFWSFPLFAVPAALLFWQCHWSINFNMRTYDHLAGSTLQAFLGILTALSLASLLTHVRIVKPALESLGRASLWILMFHTWIQYTVCDRLYPEDYPAPVRYLLIGAGLGLLLPWGLHSLHEFLQPRLRNWIARRRTSET